jgi:hypothetical protein
MKIFTVAHRVQSSYYDQAVGLYDLVCAAIERGAPDKIILRPRGGIDPGWSDSVDYEPDFSGYTLIEKIVRYGKVARLVYVKDV